MQDVDREKELFNQALDFPDPAERQALALMDHPNIAKVLDAILTLRSDLQQARWQIEQFKRSRYSPSSERVVDPELSKEQVLLSVLGPVRQRGHRPA